MGDLQRKLETARDVVVIGGGFIGIEFADEINKAGDKNVTVVEIAPHCLSLAYDKEFCVEMEKVVASRGIHICTSARVEQIAGNGKVEALMLADNTRIPADVVILGVGAVANVDGKLLNERRVTLQGHPGREMWVKAESNGEQGRVHARIYLVGRRLYQMLVAGSEAQFSESDAEYFLDSFQLR